MRPEVPVFSSNASAHQFQKNLGGPPVSQHFLAGNVALCEKPCRPPRLGLSLAENAPRSVPRPDQVAC